MPQPLMLMQPIAAATDRIGSDEDEDEEIESEDEYFHWGLFRRLIAYHLIWFIYLSIYIDTILHYE